MSEGQARPLVSIDPAIIRDILPTLIKEEWSARKIEQFIVQLKKNAEQAHEAKVASAAAMPYEADAKRLVKRLAADVSVKTNAKGAGQIVIRFKDDDDFQRIQKMLAQE
jgi:ParB family chromosome partitioning protein